MSSAIKSLSSCLKEFKQANFQGLNLFESLGVHRDDISAQEQLTVISKKIAEGEFTPAFDPKNQLVTFFDKSDRKVALFKVGLFRAEIETAARRLSYLMGSDRVVPSMLSAFDFSSLKFPVDASTLNLEAFSEPLNAPLSEFSFAVEEHPSGIRSYFLPHSTDKEISADSKLKLQGVLPGILEPFTSERETSLDTLLEVVIIAALLKARDFKEDAIAFDIFHDCEEIMPKEVMTEGEASDIKPSLNMPLLGTDLRAIKKLNEEQMLWIKNFADKLDIETLVQYAKKQKMRYRNNELEKIGLPLSQKEEDAPELCQDKERRHLCFFEETARESEYFPPIPIGKDYLFTKKQLLAFKLRLTRFKEAFTQLDTSKISEWPEMNLWGIVHKIDPVLENYCEKLLEARCDLVSKKKSFKNWPEKIIRAHFLDSSRDDLFKASLAESAGRVPLRTPRARAMSAPACMGEVESDSDDESLTRSQSYQGATQYYFNPSPTKKIEKEAGGDF